MVFLEMRSGEDRRKTETKILEPDKEKRSRPVGRRLTDRLQKIRIEPNDFFVFKIPSMTDAIKHSAQEISKFFRQKGAQVVFTVPNAQIEKFPEEQMNKLGWYKK